jgi:Na+/H+-dicarboxylate symporter/ABC-type amino acid transport substrate-binding protein
VKRSEETTAAVEAAVGAVRSKRKRRMGLPGQTMVGLGLGIGTGLFFGEHCEMLKPVADGVVAMLQMAILPYIVVSLPARIGSLSATQTRIIAGRAGAVLLALWSVTILVAAVMPTAFPEWDSGSFFSTTLTTPPQQFDLISLLIPANPFKALSDNTVSAVVVFSVALGVGLIGMPGKEGLLNVLQSLSGALSRVSHYAASLTPLGVFAISAHAAGTLTFQELERLQVFIITFVVAALVLMLVVLPLLVRGTTSCGFLAVITAARQSILTALAIDNLFIALPAIEEDCGKLLERAGFKADQVRSKLEVLVPIGFALPTLGKLLRLLFVPFAAWNSGTDLAGSDVVTLVFYGPLAMFGSVHVAIPFLLDVARIPVDEYQLYLVARIVTGRFGEALSAMGLIAFAVISVYWLQGRLVVNRLRLFSTLVASAAVILGTMIGLRIFFVEAITKPPTTREVIANLRLLSRRVPAVVHKTVPPSLAADRQAGETRVEAIQRRGELRIGFNPDNLPFSYFNGAGELVGFDIDMAHTLARELGVTLAFVPMDFSQMRQLLSEDRIDTVMSGVMMSTDRLADMRFSEPYLDGTLALVVRDHHRGRFKDWESLRTNSHLSLAVWGTKSTITRLRNELPQAEIVAVDPPSQFFESPHLDHEAMVIVGESGAAWTLVYPQYTLVVPQPALRVPLAYPAAKEDAEWAEFLSRWILIHRDGPDVRRFYRYWITGESVGRRDPRWSVLRNVIGLDPS